MITHFEKRTCDKCGTEDEAENVSVDDTGGGWRGLEPTLTISKQGGQWQLKLDYCEKCRRETTVVDILKLLEEKKNV